MMSLVSGEVGCSAMSEITDQEVISVILAWSEADESVPDGPLLMMPEMRVGLEDLVSLRNAGAPFWMIEKAWNLYREEQSWRDENSGPWEAPARPFWKRWFRK